jgi:LAO/AO transport system kinase
MQRHFLDPEVFIRSLSTRGSHGGLARSGRDVARLFDAFGKDVVIIETVGVGQTELDIMEVADTVVVVLVPEAGDTVQVMKAGLLEIADVFVVNKADRDGAIRMRTELEMMLALKATEGNRKDEWKVPGADDEGRRRARGRRKCSTPASSTANTSTTRRARARARNGCATRCSRSARKS